MNCTSTYTNSNTLTSAVKVNNEAFHKRLRHLYPCVDDVSKLPQAWSAKYKAPPLGLTYDSLGCYFKGNGRREEDEKSAAAVRTDHHIPPSCLLYYYEIKIISKGREGFMGLGLTSSRNELTKLPGWARDSYGYHADDGNTFSGDGRGHTFGPTFTTGDVIGCGYNLVEGKCFFTKNGLNLGTAFEDISSNLILYPTIGLKTPGEEIRANFGQEKFVYDIEQDLRSLSKDMTFTISNYPISDFSNWQNTLHKLVQSWLLQNSYPNTAEAFTRSTKMECKEDIQRIQQRNRIQQLVLSGRISEAIRLTNCLCPNLLQNNPNLLFALKCRQFIELISGAENDDQLNTSYADTGTSSNNGFIQRMDANGDQPESPTYCPKNNRCNGMSVNNNINNSGSCVKVENQQTGSSSIQELMDIDQPITLSSNENENRASSIVNSPKTNSSNSSILNQMTRQENKIEANGNTHLDQVADPELENNEQKFARLLQLGRELSDHLQKLDKLYGKNETNEKMLNDAIGLIAYTNPRKSCFSKLLDPSGREPICQLLNSSIVRAEIGESYRPPLETVVNHLKKLIRLNDSQGRWLVDQLY